MHISQGYSEDNIRKSGVKSCFIIFMIATLEYIILQDLTPLLCASAASKLSHLANVEVTGAARPYRAASVLTAEQGLRARI